MKNLNLNKQLVEADSNLNQNSRVEHLEFNEVLVYQEMSDQTSIRLNLVEQIHSQINQLDEMVGRKQFLVKEIFNEIVKN